MGGYVAGPALLIDVIRSFADSFISRPRSARILLRGPSRLCSTFRAHPEERARQERNVRRLTAGMPLLDTPSHILPLIIGEAHQCRRTSELLLTEHGIYLLADQLPDCAARPGKTAHHPTPFTQMMTCSISSMLWWPSARNWAGQWGGAP